MLLGEGQERRQGGCKLQWSGKRGSRFKLGEFRVREKGVGLRK